jgi:SAM-dependent methyltransferase
MSDPYDELPYESVPIEWTAPERMAVTSLLHGGPRPPVGEYRYLELGCGDATNLLPLARYRPGAQFVGVDGSATQMASAVAARDAVGLTNLTLVTASFAEAFTRLEGTFDYVVLHGVFSWVDDATRDALLGFASRALAPDGLLYVSYNTLPGWSVRGMVRDFLCAQTQSIAGLRARAQAARSAAARLGEMLGASDHPYSQLMAREFAFVRDARDSYVAHEFLADTNRAYWQSEFRALLDQHGLSFVAHADFAYASARLPEGLQGWVESQTLGGRATCDTVDLLCFAQFRCALACREGARREPWGASSLRSMRIASNMVLTGDGSGEARGKLKTGAGYDVVFQSEALERRFVELTTGASRAIEGLFDRVEDVADDLVLLHTNGAIELRAWESPLPVCPELSARERIARGEFTSPQHLRQSDGPSSPTAAPRGSS